MPRVNNFANETLLAPLQLLLSDSYLPGALVLAHSLRDAGTAKQLAVLVTLDSVSAESITQLKTVYDHVIPVPRIRNDRPANLYLMNRADLHSAFTKINLWKQTQFSKIVYIDADVVAYRAPDELFNVPHAFAAAPDIGWPDLFNTGVMVLTPNMGDYYAMMAMAERGISFDGADQGLLNMHFSNNYHRLSFTYNVTPSAHYQYVPAYRHFQSSINMVHFIGSNKPWFAGRDASFGSSPFDEMIGRWWAVYDRHYRVKETPSQQPQPAQAQAQPDIMRAITIKALCTTAVHMTPISNIVLNILLIPLLSRVMSSLDNNIMSNITITSLMKPRPVTRPPMFRIPPLLLATIREQWLRLDQSSRFPSIMVEERRPRSTKPSPNRPQFTFTAGMLKGKLSIASYSYAAGTYETNTYLRRQPPPLDSKPEAMNFPSTHYEMSQDTAPFVPPQRYPSPPKDMWYEVPKERPAPPEQQPRQIFPWEGQRPRPSRSFVRNAPELHVDVEAHNEPFGERMTATDSWPHTEPSAIGAASTETTIEPTTPTTPAIRVIPSDPWTSFPRNNAWDDVPEIGRYVEGLQKHRRVKSQGTLGGSRRGRGGGWFGSGAGDDKPHGFRLTDFPSEVERPSLPVTPAPIHRQTLWGDDDAERGEDDDSHSPLPAAEGVPKQNEWVCVHGKRWSPADCLCTLADLLLRIKDPSVQLQKLAKQQSEALLRRLSGGELELSAATREIPSRSLPYGSEPTGTDPPTFVANTTSGVLSPRPVKAGARSIPEPSYSGPGAAWEKGEEVPVQQTPLPPSEEEKDVFDT
ncbi:glycogenin-2 beta [Paramyrothecium foliicola]|nr:glycogenin-2 beta [Paramyrothecium foliicola]